jgi:streptogramin lyase
MEPTDERHPLDRLSRAADRIPATSTAGVVERVAQRRVRRQRRRRAMATAGSVALVAVAVVGAVLVPRLGDDSTEVRTADPSLEPVVLPSAPDLAVDVASDGDSVWVLVAPQAPGDPVGSTEPASLVRVDTASNTPTAVTDLPISADQVTTTDGAVWVTGLHADSVVRVDPETAAVVATIPLRLTEPVCDPAACGEDEAYAFLPNAMASAGGRVWVSTARGEVVGIDPASDTITSTAPIEGDVPGGSTGTDGAYWVAMNNLGVTRVDASTGEATAVPIGFQESVQVVVDVQPMGELVLAEVTDPAADPAADPDALVRATVVLDESGQVTNGLDRTFRGVASDGDVTWVVDAGDQLRRVSEFGELADPNFGIVLRLAGSGPATVADGAYWTTIDGRTLTRVDPDGSAQTITVVYAEPPATTDTTTSTPDPVVMPSPSATGDPEDQPDEQAAAVAFLDWLAPGSVEATIPLIEDGEALREVISAAQATAPDAVEDYSGAVDGVRLVDDDRAVVSYRILIRGATVLSTDGEAVRVDGRWVVSRDTYCAAIANGPVRCPPV